MTPYPFARVLGLVIVAVCAAALCAHAQAPSPDAQLAQARAQFEAGDYEPAIATIDPLIALLEPLAAKDPVAERLLPAAYELRARTRFQLGNADGATADFRALLKLAPAFTFTEKVSQKVSKILEDIRKTGRRQPSCSISAPVDSELELDGRPFAAAAGQIPLPVGPHTLSGRRSGCRSASQTFTVMPGASTEVVLTLERVVGDRLSGDLAARHRCVGGRRVARPHRLRASASAVGRADCESRRARQRGVEAVRRGRPRARLAHVRVLT